MELFKQQQQWFNPEFFKLQAHQSTGITTNEIKTGKPIIIETTINYAYTKHTPPTINITSDDLRRENTPLFVDTGAEISLIKSRAIKSNVTLDEDTVVNIKVVTLGESKTLGAVEIDVYGIPCTFHVTPDSINIQSEGLIGCDILQRQKGQIDMDRKT